MRWLRRRAPEEREQRPADSPPIPPGARGMHLDPRQIPAALMERAMDAGQPPDRRKP